CRAIRLLPRPWPESSRIRSTTSGSSILVSSCVDRRWTFVTSVWPACVSSRGSVFVSSRGSVLVSPHNFLWNRASRRANACCKRLKGFPSAIRGCHLFWPRCRDKTFGGYCRYVGLGILGRNLQVLGKLLIAREDPKCEAGQSRRGRNAA